MQKILRSADSALVTYTCDITWAPLPSGPSVALTVKCGIASSYDGRTYVLDFSKEAAEVVLPLLRVLLLRGAPLEKHSNDSYLCPNPPIEKRIKRGEEKALLRKLRKLSRHRERTLKWLRGTEK